jgi:peptide/nickel transport system permease protein
MDSYVWRRIAQCVLTTCGVTLIAFALVYLIPGDPAVLILGEMATPEQLKRVRADLGLDQPLPAQYMRFLRDLANGQLQSTQYHRPVRTLILERFPATLELAITAMAIAGVTAAAGAIVSAVRRDTLTDYAAGMISLFGIAMPDFWFAIMLILLFGVTMRIFPVFGYPDFSFAASVMQAIRTMDLTPVLIFARYITLPAIVLGLRMGGILMRLFRSSLLEEMRREYVLTARAKGLREYAVLSRHVARNALLPSVTMFSMEFAKLLGGAVIIETVFAWPGLGKLVVDAVYARDYPVVQAAVIFFACIFIATNLVVDMLYRRLDPRIRYT